MADSTLDSELFVLINNWGQPVSRFGQKPLDGFTGTDHHNVASATRYRLGEVWAYYNEGDSGVAGWSEFMYMKVGTPNPSVAIAVKTFCAQELASEPFIVTNNKTTVSLVPAAQAAVALSSMTATYYGWFWVGGVCPEEEVSTLGGNYATDGNVVVGSICIRALTADAIGLGTTQEVGSGARIAPCGWTKSADA